MQRRGEKHAFRMADPGKRHPQAPSKGLFGAVVRVLAPRNVAQPAGRAMNSPCSRRLAREERGRPFLQSVAIEVEAALAPSDQRADRDQRIRLPLPGGYQPIGITLAQSECRENYALRCCYANKLAEN